MQLNIALLAKGKGAGILIDAELKRQARGLEDAGRVLHKSAFFASMAIGLMERGFPDAARRELSVASSSGEWLMNSVDSGRCPRHIEQAAVEQQQVIQGLLDHLERF